jgi:hypothetical protein
MDTQCPPAGAERGSTGSFPYLTIDVNVMATALERVHELGGSIVHPGERWAVCREG